MGDRFEESLQGQRNVERLNLAEMYLSDRQIKKLAQYLSEFREFTMIDLRGNNLRPDSLAELFGVLRGNKRLKTLSLEWNNLGLDNRGVEALIGLLRSSPNISEVDLRNNKIGPEQAIFLANFLRDNESLRRLDLRWNEIGQAGAKSILTAIKTNKCLEYLELSGNNIPGFLIDEINGYLSRGGGGRPRESERYPPPREPYGPPEYPPPPYGESMPRRGGPPIPFPDENIIVEERFRAREDRERMARDMESLREKSFKDQKSAKDLGVHLEEMRSDNERLSSANERLVKEIDKLNERNLVHIRGLEERLAEADTRIRDLDRNHQMEIERVQKENASVFRELEKNADIRTKTMEDVIRTTKIGKENAEREMVRLQDSLMTMRREQEDRLRELGGRIQEEEYQKYRLSLESIQAKFHAVEQSRENQNKRNSDLIHEFQAREARYLEEISKLEGDVDKLRHDNDILNHDLKEIRILLDKMKADLGTKDSYLRKLEGENLDLQKTLQLRKDVASEQMEVLIEEQKMERRRWEDFKELQNQKLDEKDKLLRETHAELMMLKQDYQRLIEILQVNVSKAIFQTFADNTYV